MPRLTGGFLKQPILKLQAMPGKTDIISSCRYCKARDMYAYYFLETMQDNADIFHTEQNIILGNVYRS